MNKLPDEIINQRKKSIDAAMGSVMADKPDWMPDRSTIDDLHAWANGELTTEQVRKNTLNKYLRGQSAVDTSIIIMAMRYQLGRATYGITEIYDAIKNNWHHFTFADRDLIIREISTALGENNTGMEMDTRLWRQLLDYCNENRR